MNAGSSPIIVPDAATAKAALSPDYDPNVAIQVNEESAPPTTRVRNPIKRIYAMHAYVIFELTYPTARYPNRRKPLDYREALKRLQSINRRHEFEDAGKPKDEIVYEQWMVENTIKAIAQCGTNVGQPFSSPAVNAALRAMDIRMKKIPNRK